MSKADVTSERVTALEYAAPVHARPRVALYRVAQFCWAAPLLMGLGSLALFVVTRAQPVALAGFLTILGGAALFGVGVICLIVFWCLLRRCAADERRTWSRRAGVLLGLLVLNFPIAVGCAAGGIWLMSRFSVTIVNATGAPIEQASVVLPGHAVNFGTLQPGASVRQTFSLQGDGDLEFSAVRGGVAVAGEAGAYLDGMYGDVSEATVTFGPAGHSTTLK